MKTSITKHQGSNQAMQKPNPDPACMPKMTPFFANTIIYVAMAKELQTDPDFIMALSSMESGWLDPHNQSLHNLFGVTNAGKNNLAFASYQKAADYWLEHFGPFVKGARTMDDFAAGLKKAKYNTANPDYYTHLKNQLKTVIKFKTVCGVK